MTEEVVRVAESAESVDASALAPAGHEAMTQPFADALDMACDEKQWVRCRRNAAVCWEAPRLRYARCLTIHDFGAMFRVHPTTIGWCKTRDKWEPLSSEALEAL